MTSIALHLPVEPSRPKPAGSAGPSAWLVLLFGLSMFALLTSWAKLDPDLSVRIVNDKRMFATGLGALVYWFTIRTIAARPERSLGGMIGAALAVGLPGTALILAAREMFDLFTSPDGSEGFARNVRWLLLWLGYYGAWVAGFVAVQFHRCATARLAAAPARRTATSADWLIDTIAAELAAQPGLDREALARRLLGRLDYEQADGALDPEAPHAAARRNLTLRLAARLRRQRP